MELDRDRWEYLNDLDEELLKGAVILSEWCAFIVREADVAFAAGADLAAILTSVSAIETHLRTEQGDGRSRLVDLIEKANVDDSLRASLHELRRYRNRWVHVERPEDDEALLEDPESKSNELRGIAFAAMRTLRLTIYSNPWI